VRANPEDPEAHFRLGNFYQTLEQFDDAEGC
jgi:cytochrome c-type biogenesis protein CcmH/NrfG